MYMRIIVQLAATSRPLTLQVADISIANSERWSVRLLQH